MDLGQLLFFTVIIFNLAAIFYIIFIERREPGNATVWILALIMLPLLGFILYLLFGRHYFKEKRFALKARSDQETLAGFVKDQMAALDKAGVDGTCEREPLAQLMNLLLANNDSLVTEKNEVRSFVTGQDKFDALLQAIRGAKSHIHMEYYIIRDDALGRGVVAALTEKAHQGVEVRLLYDVLGNKIPAEGYQDLKAAGGRVTEFYRSLLPAITLRVNYHDHRKIAVIDGTIGFLGGFNIGEEYLGKGPLGFWRDTAVEVRGRGASLLQLRFLLDWNYATKEGLTITPKHFPVWQGRGTSSVQVVSGGPDNRWNPIKEEYLKLISIAKKYVYLQTPYFVPDPSIMSALRIAAQSGVDVRIMIPDKPDHPLVYWATTSFTGELLDAGVRTFTYNNGFIHAKTCIVDDLVSSIGTANWDIRSFRLNFETNAVIYDAEFATRQRKHFEDDLKVCTEVTLESYGQRPMIVRAKEGVARLFSSVL
ncbi:MAG: cardiolipin synthase [Methanomassiliicoccus sp.]|nr:cardiolipin synthase [Methanomassiliicoccus sp.]